MATLKQKKLAEEIVQNLSEGNKKTAKELLVSSGYSEKSAKSSSKEIIEQKGVQQELIVRGFDPETAKSVVAEILVGAEEDRDRLKAADMIFKVNGEYAPEKHINMNFNAELTSQEGELAAALIELLF